MICESIGLLSIGFGSKSAVDDAIFEIVEIIESDYKEML